MSKQAVIVIVVLVILFIGGVITLMALSRPAALSPAKQEQTQRPSATPIPTKSTLQSLMSAGGNQTCSITYPEQNSQGTVYVTNGKFRGDFTVMAGSKQIVSHMIQSDGFAYIWTDETKTGTKMNLEEAKKMTQSTQSATTTSSPQGVPTDKQVDMNCSPWSLDESKFTIPTDIQFTDLSAMMKDIPTTKTSGAPKMNASICNQIADPTAKAACLKQFGQ